MNWDFDEELGGTFALDERRFVRGSRTGDDEPDAPDES